MSVMAPQDATMYWLSKRTRNDLFLLYCFADSGQSTEELRATVARRSGRIDDLRVRLRELPADIDYPSWVPCEFAAEQFVEHQLAEADWSHVLDVLADLLGTGVDAAVRPWRLHVFREIVDAPGPGDGPALVVVVQMSHALADGRRGSAIARALFAEQDAESDEDRRRRPVASGPGVAGRVPVEQGTRSGLGADSAGECPGSRTTAARKPEVAAAVLAGGLVIGSTVPVPEPMPFGALVESARGLLRLPVLLASTAARGYRAFRAQQRLAYLTDTGRLPPPAPGYPPSLVNRTVSSEISRREVRLLVYPAERVRATGRTVTVVVLTAVSLALSRYLAERGEPAERLGAQVPMALPEPSAGRGAYSRGSGARGSDPRGSGPRNNYRALGVELFADVADVRERADKIAAALVDRRIRARHPLLSAQDRVTATLPAAILRRDIDRYPLDAVPDSIEGHTVVSSVDRGPADLAFCGGRVLFTGGFPALGSVMHLTHGVHGLGDTVTLSLHADAAVLPDLDAYAALLHTALEEVTSAC